MNIIIEPENLEAYQNKYTVLELDKIKILPENQVVTAYCVVEQVPIMEMNLVESKSKLHANLIENYRKKDWNFCTQALEHLIGSWGGELDSFYADLQARITQYQEQDPGETWDGIIEKHSS